MLEFKLDSLAYFLHISGSHMSAYESIKQTSIQYCIIPKTRFRSPCLFFLPPRDVGNNQKQCSGGYFQSYLLALRLINWCDTRETLPPLTHHLVKSIHNWIQGAFHIPNVAHGKLLCPPLPESHTSSSISSSSTKLSRMAGIGQPATVL